MVRGRRVLVRRDFLWLVGLAAVAAACGQRLSGVTTSMPPTAVTSLDPVSTTSPGTTTPTGIAAPAPPAATISRPGATSPPPEPGPTTASQTATTVTPTTAPPPTTPTTTIGPSPPATNTPPPTTTVPRTTTPPPTTTTTTTVPPTTTAVPSSTTTSPPPLTTTTTTNVVTGPVSLRIEPRAAWGARDPVAELLVPHSRSMNRLTVHHSGDNTAATGPARFRIWQNYHMNVRGWGDVAYHYIIGLSGGVYTARSTDYRGDTGTDYDPDRHLIVVLEGNFQNIDPTAEQIDRLPILLAWAAARFGINTSTIAGTATTPRPHAPGQASTRSSATAHSKPRWTASSPTVAYNSSEPDQPSFVVERDPWQAMTEPIGTLPSGYCSTSSGDGEPHVPQRRPARQHQERAAEARPRPVN